MESFTHSLDVLARTEAWHQAGCDVALATVVRTWGSSPRPVGSHLAMNAAGEFVGSVSGGCIEGAVIDAAKDVLAGHVPRLLDFGVSDERAWEVGLSCGGRIQVFVERLGVPFDRLLEARRRGQVVAQVIRLADGAQTLVDNGSADGELFLEEPQLAAVRALFSGGSSGMLDESAGLFVRLHVPPPRLMIVGAVHIAQVLAPMARLAGFAVTVVDPRRAFLSPERFPDIDLCDEWPDDALARMAPDTGSAVVTLSHDPKIDDPALVVALNSASFYIGALGSRQTHEKRLARLAEQGLANRAHRIHAPIGLDLGGRTPAEIAVAILADMVRTRHRGDGA